MKFSLFLLFLVMGCFAQMYMQPDPQEFQQVPLLAAQPTDGIDFGEPIPMEFQAMVEKHYPFEGPMPMEFQAMAQKHYGQPMPEDFFRKIWNGVKNVVRKGGSTIRKVASWKNKIRSLWNAYKRVMRIVRQVQRTQRMVQGLLGRGKRSGMSFGRPIGRRIRRRRREQPEPQDFMAFEQAYPEAFQQMGEPSPEEAFGDLIYEQPQPFYYGLRKN